MLHMSDQSWNSSWGSAAKVEAFPNGGDLPSKKHNTKPTRELMQTSCFQTIFCSLSVRTCEVIIDWTKIFKIVPISNLTQSISRCNCPIWGSLTLSSLTESQSISEVVRSVKHPLTLVAPVQSHYLLLAITTTKRRETERQGLFSFTLNDLVLNDLVMNG